MTAFRDNLLKNPALFLDLFFIFVKFVLLTIDIDDYIFKELQELVVSELNLKAVKNNQRFFDVLDDHFKVCFLLCFCHEIHYSLSVHLLRYPEDVDDGKEPQSNSDEVAFEI